MNYLNAWDVHSQKWSTASSPRLSFGGITAQWLDYARRDSDIVVVTPDSAVTSGRDMPRVATVSSAAVTWIEAAAVESLGTHYAFKGRAEVAAFLGARPHLVSLLVAAYPVVENIFGLGTLVNVELFVYPDAPHVREIFGLITTNLPVDEAMKKLRAFQAHWWHEARPEARGELTFDVEFI